MKHLRHPATIIAGVALFVALGGGAAAYASGLISGSQIKNHSIPASKLTKSAVKSLHGLRGARGAAGTQGIQGIQGIQGKQGVPGPSSATSVFHQNSVNFGTNDVTITSLALPAGSYVVMGKTYLDNGADEQSFCELASQSKTLDLTYSSTTSSSNTATVSLLAPLTTTGSTVGIDCESTDSGTSALDTHLIAIKVGSLSGS